MLTGLAGGALWALDTVILGMALALPVFTGDPRAAILAPFASTFLHDLCSSLWMLGYTGLRRQYKAVWQAIRTRGGRFVALGALLGGPVGMTGYVLAINAIGPAYTAIISALYPALGTVLAHFFLKEKLRPTGLIGLALSIGGVIALGYTPGAALPKGHLLGFGCALLCCIGWAAEGVICTYGLQSSTVTNAQALQIRQPVSALTMPLFCCRPARAGALPPGCLARGHCGSSPYPPCAAPPLICATTRRWASWAPARPCP